MLPPNPLGVDNDKQALLMGRLTGSETGGMPNNIWVLTTEAIP